MDHLSDKYNPKLSKNVCIYLIIPSSLFTTIYFKQAKTVRWQEPRASFWGILNELIKLNARITQIPTLFKISKVYTV